MPHHQSTVTVIEIRGRARTLVRRRFHFQGLCLFFGLGTWTPGECPTRTLSVLKNPSALVFCIKISYRRDWQAVNLDKADLQELGVESWWFMCASSSWLTLNTFSISARACTPWQFLFCHHSDDTEIQRVKPRAVHMRLIKCWPYPLDNILALMYLAFF